jgi:hypothetical protein
LKIKKRKNANSEQDQQNYQKHIAEKNFAREEKRNDCERMKEDKTLSMLCFDLQSVIPCPQSSISVFYYKKKLAIYNLTVCEVKDMEGHCLLWHEGIAGRTGNVIASALVTALEKIAQDRPNVKHILWSDSCVAQNKNSHMSSALLNFLKENLQVTTIKQKFQEPGHSCVQQVDNVHSVLDKRLKGQELHSFLSVTRAIIKAKQRKPYKIIQLQRKNFKNFKKLAYTFLAAKNVMICTLQLF